MFDPDYSSILVSFHNSYEIGGCRQTYTFEWTHPERKIASVNVDDVVAYSGIDCDQLVAGKVFTLGGLRLVVMAVSPPETNSLEVMRRTRFSWYWVLKYRLSRLWYGFTRRLLWTAVVWGLAERPGYATVLGWRDLKIVRWWNRRRGKKKD